MVTNTNYMQHKKTVLFLISLSQRTIQDIEDKGVNYQLFLQMVRSYSHVEIHEEISEELIGTASQYQVVTIVGHNINDCIELADGSLFPMRKIASALPPTFDGYLHVAVCGSSIFFDAIKERTPNSRVRTSEDFEELELDLLIYSELLSRLDLRKDTFDDYYGAYYNYIKEEQEHQKPADIAKFPRATKLGTMATGERPFEVPRNSEFFIRVIFHDESSEETIEENIAKAYNISYKFKDSILEELKDGDTVYVNLDFNSRYDEMTKDLILGGGERLFPFDISKAKNKVIYRCYVEDGFRLNGFSGTVTIKIKDNPVDSWEFPIRVTPNIDEYTNGRSSNNPSDEHSDNRRLNRSPFGPQVNYIGTPPPTNRHSTKKSEKEKENVLTDDLLAQAVKAVQQFMWGQSAYAVLYCECRDNRNYQGNMTQFECKIDGISEKYNLKRCPPGTLSDAFRHNKYLYKPIDKWKENGAKPRSLQLLKKFQEALP